MCGPLAACVQIYKTLVCIKCIKTLCIIFFSEYLSNNNYCHRNVPSFLSILLEISSSRISLRSSSRIMLFRLWQQETNHRIQWFMYFLVRTSRTIIIVACLARATWLCIIFLSQTLAFCPGSVSFQKLSKQYFQVVWRLLKMSKRISKFRI